MIRSHKLFENGDGILRGGVPEVPLGHVKYTIKSLSEIDGLTRRFGVLKVKKGILDRALKLNDLVLQMADNSRVPIRLEMFSGIVQFEILDA